MLMMDWAKQTSTANGASSGLSGARVIHLHYGDGSTAAAIEDAVTLTVIVYN